MPWKPRFPGERPTLGYHVIEWVEANLAVPNAVEYQPLIFTREQAEFVLRYYELDPVTGRRLIRRGVLSRPRGWGKSPFVSALCIVEGLADVVPDGWDAQGRPVGKPWAAIRWPVVQLAAVTEKQVVRNTWRPLLRMLDPQIDPPVYDNYPGLERMDTFVNLPRGKIEYLTAEGSSAKGSPEVVFTVWDQTEEWKHGNGGLNLADILADNSAKVGGSYIETPNAFVPGEGSVAENSANAWKAIQEKRARGRKDLLYDHREAPADTDLTDRESLLAGLRYVYGDSSDDPRGCVLHDPPCEPGWAPHDAHIARIWDPDNDEQNARANFLGQITHATDSWLSQPDWNARKSEVEVKPGDVVTLGFDGSRGRVKGKPDATALVGCRVSDGHVFQLRVWEADDRTEQWPDWTPPIGEIEAELADAFRRYNVVGFYADPGRDWRSHVNAWEATYGARVKVKVTATHPFEWWMTGGRSTKVEAAVESLEGAVVNGDMTHDGSASLTKHVLNARRRLSHGRLALGKSSAASVHKIDAAVAAVLAWQARLDALAAGHGKRPGRQVIRKVR